MRLKRPHSKFIGERQRATIVGFAVLYVRWLLIRRGLAQKLEAPRPVASFLMLLRKLKPSLSKQRSFVETACHEIRFPLPVNAERLTGGSANGECFCLGLLQQR